MGGRSQKPFSTSARARARRTAVQAYYQWLMTGQPIDAVIEEFEQERKEHKKADKAYFKEIVSGMARHAQALDDVLTPLLDRPLNEIGPVEHAIMQLGIYELTYHPELPWRVVLNESVELAKMFGAEQSHKYINGVLDKAAHQIRQVEIAGGSG